MKRATIRLVSDEGPAKDPRPKSEGAAKYQRCIERNSTSARYALTDWIRTAPEADLLAFMEEMENLRVGGLFTCLAGQIAWGRDAPPGKPLKHDLDVILGALTWRACLSRALDLANEEDVVLTPPLARLFECVKTWMRITPDSFGPEPRKVHLGPGAWEAMDNFSKWCQEASAAELSGITADKKMEWAWEEIATHGQAAREIPDERVNEIFRQYLDVAIENPHVNEAGAQWLIKEAFELCLNKEDDFLARRFFSHPQRELDPKWHMGPELLEKARSEMARLEKPGQTALGQRLAFIREAMQDRELRAQALAGEQWDTLMDVLEVSGGRDLLEIADGILASENLEGSGALHHAMDIFRNARAWQLEGITNEDLLLFLGNHNKCVREAGIQMAETLRNSAYRNSASVQRQQVGHGR